MSSTDSTPTNSTPTGSGPTDSTPDSTERHTAGAFDIRSVIGALLGVYGVILLVTGLVSDNTAGKPDPDDYNANLIAGAVLIVVGVLFLLWARLKPIAVPADPGEDDRADG